VQTTAPPSESTEITAEFGGASEEVQLIPSSEVPTGDTKASTAPIVIERSAKAASQAFYLDEAMATFHAEGCPEIRPGMTRGVKVAATLRGFKPHSCVR
jgi:hypothetical protein